MSHLIGAQQLVPPRPRKKDKSQIGEIFAMGMPHAVKMHAYPGGAPAIMLAPLKYTYPEGPWNDEGHICLLLCRKICIHRKTIPQTLRDLIGSKLALLLVAIIVARCRLWYSQRHAFMKYSYKRYALSCSCTFSMLLFLIFAFDLLLPTLRVDGKI